MSHHFHEAVRHWLLDQGIQARKVEWVNHTTGSSGGCETCSFEEECYDIGYVDSDGESHVHYHFDYMSNFVEQLAKY